MLVVSRWGGCHLISIVTKIQFNTNFTGHSLDHLKQDLERPLLYAKQSNESSWPEAVMNVLQPPRTKGSGKLPRRVNLHDSTIEIWYLYFSAQFSLPELLTEDPWTPPKIIILPFIVAEHE